MISKKLSTIASNANQDNSSSALSNLSNALALSLNASRIINSNSNSDI